jgi:F-type H+-transporting ATPase subunit a
VELIGMLAKPFALCIRLFANMMGGHVVILSLLGLIFILESVLVVPIAVGFTLFILMLELLVAFIQAYIFTMLTSLFIGMSVHPH